MPNTAPRPSDSASMAPLRSLLPVSTATTRWTCRVWFSKAPVVRGIHAAPSWATMTAVTTCWACELLGDTYPLAAQGGHLPGYRADWPAWSQRGGDTREQYAKARQAGSQMAKTPPGEGLR